jgi:uncharacterized protein
MRRVTPTIWTYAGPDIDLARPSVEAFRSLTVVARSLGNQARYLGHTARTYSVAEHSFHAWALTPSRFSRHALLHDAHEAVTGDIPAPWKALVPEFEAHEIGWMCAAAAAFRLDWTEAARTAVDVVDRSLLATELRDLMEIPGDVIEADLEIAPLPISLQRMTPGPEGWAGVWEYHVRHPAAFHGMHPCYVMSGTADTYIESKLEIRRRIIAAFSQASLELDQLDAAA